MTRSQRIFLAISLPLFAWLLHVNLCDWHYRESVSFGTNRVGVYEISRESIWHRSGRDPATGSYATTGLTTGEWINLETALLFGIFLPLALVVADIFWLLGWRRHRRLAAGCCIACGYDLKGSPAANCPECGAATDKKGTSST